MCALYVPVLCVLAKPDRYVTCGVFCMLSCFWAVRVSATPTGMFPGRLAAPRFVQYGLSLHYHCHCHCHSFAMFTAHVTMLETVVGGGVCLLIPPVTKTHTIARMLGLCTGCAMHGVLCLCVDAYALLVDFMSVQVSTCLVVQTNKRPLHPSAPSPGQDYAGAPSEWVYVYFPGTTSDSAFFENNDEMLLGGALVLHGPVAYRHSVGKRTSA